MTQHSPAGPAAGGRTIVIRASHLLWLAAPLAAAAAGYAYGTGLLQSLLGAVPLGAGAELDASTSLWLVVLAGLSVGGLSCLAVQGGLLTTVIMQREKQLRGAAAMPGIGQRLVPVVQFLAAKTLAYTALGAALGYFGSKVPLRVQAWLLIAVGVFMVIIVFQMFDVHPFFRRFAVQPPKAVQRFLRSEAKGGGAAAPVGLGALTVLIPCGVTLAMEGLAMASQSAPRGAAIMFAFTLGTAPLFLGLGFVATNLSRGAFRIFQPLAAVLVVAIAANTVLGGMRLLGVTTGLSTDGVTAEASLAQAADPSAAQIQEVTIQVATLTYTPSNVKLRSGIPARLTLVTDNTQGCIRAFTIPALGIERLLPATGTEVIELPAIDPGKVVFTCSMGMYSGVLDVVASAAP